MNIPKDYYGPSMLMAIANDAEMRRLFMQSPIVHACFGFYLRRECSWETALKMAVVELTRANAKLVNEMQMAPAPTIIVEEKK